MNEISPKYKSLFLRPEISAAMLTWSPIFAVGNSMLSYSFIQFKLIAIEC